MRVKMMHLHEVAQGKSPVKSIYDPTFHKAGAVLNI